LRTPAAQLYQKRASCCGAVLQDVFARGVSFCDILGLEKKLSVAQIYITLSTIRDMWTFLGRKHTGFHHFHRSYRVFPFFVLDRIRALDFTMTLILAAHMCQSSCHWHINNYLCKG